MSIDVPFELVLEIFSELATFSANDALALSTLSSTVKRCIARQLYETVTLKSARQVNAFLALLKEREGAKGYVNPAPLVKNMCITHHVISTRQSSAESEDPTVEIFELCPNLERIALQSTFLHSSLVSAHSVQRLRCKSLFLVGPTFPSDWERHVHAIHNTVSEERLTSGGARSGSLLTDVSDLNILDPLSSTHFSIPCLAHLPNLSRIALIQDPGKSRVEFSELDALLRIPKLSMIVMSFDLRSLSRTRDALDELADRAKKHDDRIFVLERLFEDSLGGWERSVRGGEDIWERAIREQLERDLRQARSIIAL
ncbi:hypothetical protein SCHPADRAFT_903961 [Schizopora paradoxa]|uniref:F-box domain-containing protein n=1 Tax=Schizopora paradoxa TaxID=27342 RepID=A0A0H2S9T6_9AGAM|nr:hypothetical protein SCHPADRAFT_903961 [Schizopora paradoxa]